MSDVNEPGVQPDLGEANPAPAAAPAPAKKASRKTATAAASMFDKGKAFSTVIGKTGDGHKFTQEGVKYDADGEPLPDKANMEKEALRGEIQAKRDALAAAEAELEAKRKALMG